MRTVLIFLLWVPTFAHASHGEGEPRLERLYASFISPCCWRENLTAHESPEATRLRARIVSMVHDGQDDEAIKQTLVAQYGKRILSLPEGQPRVWLFWTPIVFLAAGAGILSWALRKMRRLAPSAPDSPLAQFGSDWELE